MATRRFKISPGKTEFQIVEEVGAAANSDIVELTVDMDSLVNTTSGTRKITKSELLDALEMLKNHIVKSGWPVA